MRWRVPRRREIVVTRDGVEVGRWQGERLPDVDLLLSSLTSVAPGELAVSLRVDDESTTSPTTVEVRADRRARAGAAHHRRPAGAGRPTASGVRVCGGRGAPGSARWSISWSSGVLVLWTFVAPATDDDGYFVAAGPQRRPDRLGGRLRPVPEPQLHPVHLALPGAGGVAAVGGHGTGAAAGAGGGVRGAHLGRGPRADPPRRRPAATRARGSPRPWRSSRGGSRTTWGSGPNRWSRCARPRRRRCCSLAGDDASARARLAGPGRRRGGRRRPHRRRGAAGRAGGGPAAAGPAAARRQRSTGSARRAPCCGPSPSGPALTTALLLGFADGALRDFLRGQAVTAAVFTPDGWADEAGRYAFLLDPIPMGSFARRAAVLTCLLALAWFAVLAIAARARRVPLPAPLVLTASATALGFAALALTPSKWTHHFGALAGVGAAFLGLLLVSAVPLTRAVLRGAGCRRWCRRALAGVVGRRVRAGLARPELVAVRLARRGRRARTSGRPWAASPLDHPLLWLALARRRGRCARRRAIAPGRRSTSATPSCAPCRSSSRRRSRPRRPPPSGCSRSPGSAGTPPGSLWAQNVADPAGTRCGAAAASACSTRPTRRRSCAITGPGTASTGSPPAAGSSPATGRRPARCGAR